MWKFQKTLFGIELPGFLILFHYCFLKYIYIKFFFFFLYICFVWMSSAAVPRRGEARLYTPKGFQARGDKLAFYSISWEYSPTGLSMTNWTHNGVCLRAELIVNDLLWPSKYGRNILLPRETNPETFCQRFPPTDETVYSDCSLGLGAASCPKESNLPSPSSTVHASIPPSKDRGQMFETLDCNK